MQSSFGNLSGKRRKGNLKTVSPNKYRIRLACLFDSKIKRGDLERWTTGEELGEFPAWKFRSRGLFSYPLTPRLTKPIPRPSLPVLFILRIPKHAGTHCIIIYLPPVIITIFAEMTGAALESRLRIRPRARSARPLFAQAEDNIQFQFVSH